MPSWLCNDRVLLVFRETGMNSARLHYYINGTEQALTWHASSSNSHFLRQYLSTTKLLQTPEKKRQQKLIVLQLKRLLFKKK